MNRPHYLYFATLMALLIIAAECLAGIIFCAASRVVVPESLVAIGSMATGALVGFLVPSPARQLNGINGVRNGSRQTPAGTVYPGYTMSQQSGPPNA